MALDVAAAVSEHPIPAHAVGACLGEVLEAGGPGPVAVVVAVTEALVGALEDVVSATRQLLGPETLLAVTVGGVVGGAREVDGRGAVMVFAVWDPAGRSGPVRPVRLATTATPEGNRTVGLDDVRGAEGTLVLFADPFSVDGAGLLEDLQLVAPALRVVGGELSAARYPGGNRLVLGTATWTDGAVGLLFGSGADDGPLVSRAARGVGPTMTVTEVVAPGRADGVTVVTGLAGRPARARLDEVLEDLPPEERALAASGLYLGDAPLGDDDDDTGAATDQRSLLGVDADSGGLAFGGEVEVGAAVRFEVRDPDAVEPELLAQAAAGAGAAASGAFVVMSATRGARFHGRSDVDAVAVAEAMGPRPVAGVVVGAEFAAIGGRNRRVTSSVVVQPVG